MPTDSGMLVASRARGGNVAGGHPGIPTAVTLRRALPWLLVASSLAIGYRAVMPPSPLPESTALDQFSAVRAASHVEIIAAEPHPMGSLAIEDVRDYITTELESIGLEVEAQRILRPSYFEHRTVPVVNLAARIRGTASSGTIVLVGHHDTYPETPGANDNSAAVAALLETGRALVAGPPVRNDILLLFTDAEEPEQRYGAVAFVAQHPAFADIALVVNLEATGGHGASLLAETSGPEEWLVNQLHKIGSRPAAFSFLTETGRLLGEIGTDFDKFRNAGVSGFNFAYVQGSDIYHTADDNIAALSLGSLQHHGDHMLGISRHFGDLDLTVEPAEHGAVYFSLPPFLVAYPATWAIPLMLLAVTLAASGLVRSRSRPAGSSIHKPGMAALVGLGALVAGTLGWMVVVAARPSLGFVQAYAAFALIAAASATSVMWANSRFRPATVRALGPVVTLVALSGVTAFVAVGFSYLFALPTLAAGIALWLDDNDIGRHFGFGIVAVVTILLMLPAIDTFLHFASPRPGNPGSNLTVTIVIPLALVLLTAGTLRSFWPTTQRDAGDR